MEERRLPGPRSCRLGDLPTVRAVSLGGSRAEGTNRPDSDWDFSLYYRGRFDPQRLRDIGWPGAVSEIGGWGGGASAAAPGWRSTGARCDVHYRDLDSHRPRAGRGERGPFPIEPLMYHLAGMPAVPGPGRAGRQAGPARPAADPGVPGGPAGAGAQRVVEPGRPDVQATRARNQAPYGRLVQCAGLVRSGRSQSAHAVLAARGQWVTNEKTLLTRAGLRQVDDFLAAATPDPAVLREVVEQTWALVPRRRNLVGRGADRVLECRGGPCCRAGEVQRSAAP